MTTPAYVSGGAVPYGTPVLVGERGPERIEAPYRVARISPHDLCVGDVVRKTRKRLAPDGQVVTRNEWRKPVTELDLPKPSAKGRRQFIKATFADGSTFGFDVSGFVYIKLERRSTIVPAP